MEEAAAKRGDKAWGAMLKNIQDGLEAIAKKAEGAGKAMEDTGKKAHVAWGTDLSAFFDRVIGYPGLP